MEKRKLKFILGMLVAVVLFILGSFVFASLSMNNIAKEATVAQHLNAIGNLEDEALMIEAQRNIEEAPYGSDPNKSVLNLNVDSALYKALTIATGIKTVSEVDSLMITPIDREKFAEFTKANKDKTGEMYNLDNYYVILAGSAAGSVIYYNPDKPVIDKDHTEYFGKEITYNH